MECLQLKMKMNMNECLTQFDYALLVIKDDGNDLLDEDDHVVEIHVCSTKPRTPYERILKNKSEQKIESKRAQQQKIAEENTGSQRQATWLIDGAVSRGDHPIDVPRRSETQS
ncbi:hypothetical protein L2E82_24970 [Cichorium intybus]|uniref:Uncharacterized protein n=1 Tax=Cichorium intybus TaxID=13427 RepID=A0ACB9E2Y3_CICIN|nr:hypothetical protein L2E82_24970 [Cichorium intybus]